MTTPLLDIDDLTVRYRTDAGDLTAVSDASFTIDGGEYFGLAGESGSGKSTIARAIMGGLDDNGMITSGEVRYDGEDITEYSERELNEKIRWKEISWIPQGSMNSLDPLQRISEQAIEIADVHTDLSDEEAVEKFTDMFEVVGLPRSRAHDYPHQFSGGMQQRAIIALALFLEPSLIIADEPTTALDVIMQDQIFNYLNEIRSVADTSMLMITHDISLIFEACDSMAIMHGSQIAETGTVEQVYDSPRHPYSILFQNAFPDIRSPNKDLEIIEGHPPQLIGDVDFCSFAERCPWATEECRAAAPDLEPVEDGSEHRAKCVHKDTAHEEYAAEREEAQAQPTIDLDD